MTRDEAIELVRSTLVTMTGVNDSLMLLADADMVRPNAEHAWLRLRTDEVVGWPVVDDSGDLAEIHRLRFDLEVVGYALVPDFKRACARLRLRDDPDGYALSVAGVAVESIAPWSVIPVPFRSTYEPREMCSIVVQYKQTDTAPTFGEVSSITVDAVSSDGLAYTETFPIPPEP